MRIRCWPLWGLCLLVLAGCDSLLSDLSGTLCNPDGSCPEGYHCAADTERCEAGPGPTPQAPTDAGSDGGTPEDGGTSDAGSDAGVCTEVLTCASGDGCCPSGCHADSDGDCAPVCGNGQVEAAGGESCDDGNTQNGDNCDPTCRYFNVMSTLSGVPGSRSFADGSRDIARLHGPAGILSDGSRTFITDANNATVRQFQNGLLSTLAGLSFRKQHLDGQGADAGFVSPGDVALLEDSLYIVDAPGLASSRLRRLDLDGGVVSTPDAGFALTQLRGVGREGNALLLLDGNGLHRWEPATGARTLIASTSSFAPFAGANCEDVALHPLEPNVYYLACNRSIVRVSAADAGVSASLYAGSTTSTGCISDGGTTTSRFTRARSLEWASAGIPISHQNLRLYIADPGCQTVLQARQGQVTPLAGTVNTAGYANGPAGSALFNVPQAIDVFSFAGEPTIHVADLNNAAYRTVSDGGVTTSAGAPPNATLSYGDGGTPATYSQVTLLAVDGEAGVLYAYTPGPRRLFQVSLETGVPRELMVFPASPQPLGMTVLQGTLYVALNNKTVARLVPGSPATLEHLAGQASASSPSADGDLATAILFASDMATDGEDLYFHDLGARTLRKIDLQSGLVTTLAGGADPASLPDGGTQLIVDGTGREARFANALGLTSDGQSLYLLDGHTANLARTVVRKVHLATAEVTTLAGDPLTPWSALDGVGREARFAGALRLATDGRVLFISDSGGGHGMPDLTSPAIRMLDLRTLEVTTMVGTRGQWTLKNGTGRGAAINAPGPIDFDPKRNWVIFFDLEENVFQRIR